MGEEERSAVIMKSPVCLPTAREHKATWEALEDLEVRFGGDLYPHFLIFVSIQKVFC